jgi:hypothetical protein
MYHNMRVHAYRGVCLCATVVQCTCWGGNLSLVESHGQGALVTSPSRWPNVTKCWMVAMSAQKAC